MRDGQARLVLLGGGRADEAQSWTKIGKRRVGLTCCTTCCCGTHVKVERTVLSWQSHEPDAWLVLQAKPTALGESIKITSLSQSSHKFDGPFENLSSSLMASR